MYCFIIRNHSVNDVDELNDEGQTLRAGAETNTRLNPPILLEALWAGRRRKERRKRLASGMNSLALSYGINIWVTDPRPGNEGKMPGEWYWRSRDVKRVNFIPLFLDDYHWDTRPHHTDQPPEYEGQVDGWSTNAMKMLCLNRHNGNTNSLFLDFSVRKVGLKELWRLKWHRNYDLNAPLPQWPDWMKRFRDP